MSRSPFPQSLDTLKEHLVGYDEGVEQFKLALLTVSTCCWSGGPVAASRTRRGSLSGPCSTPACSAPRSPPTPCRTTWSARPSRTPTSKRAARSTIPTTASSTATSPCWRSFRTGRRPGAQPQYHPLRAAVEVKEQAPLPRQPPQRHPHRQPGAARRGVEGRLEPHRVPVHSPGGAPPRWGRFQTGQVYLQRTGTRRSFRSWTWSR